MKRLFLMFVLSLLAVTAVEAQAGKRQKEFNLTKASIAIGGYDPVAYFTQGEAVEGNKSFAFTYEGVTYYFVSAKNLELFKSRPSSYEPQYGGWCAYAMGAKGEKVEIDPETFKIVDGKLYLFYNKYFNNTLKAWNKNESALKAKADANWLKVFKS